MPECVRRCAVSAMRSCDFVYLVRDDEVARAWRHTYLSFVAELAQQRAGRNCSMKICPHLMALR